MINRKIVFYSFSTIMDFLPTLVKITGHGLLRNRKIDRKSVLNIWLGKTIDNS